METYTPDSWTVLRLSGKRTVTRILSTWNSSLTSAPEWRLNSGIESVEEYEDHFVFTGYSGSTIIAYKDRRGRTRLMNQLIEYWKQHSIAITIEEVCGSISDIVKTL